MPETYNPQLRTFIKKPEATTCITCGQLIMPDVQPLSNHMNNYLNKINGKIACFNSNEDTLEIQGVVLYKVTGKNADGTPKVNSDDATRIIESVPSTSMKAAPIKIPSLAKTV